jgi:mannose-6-phosphate isomerase-like protein (cupin superfamily)
MNPVDGYFVIKPEDLHWRPANIMKIPNADFLERTKSEILGARLWRYPPKSAGTLHRHIKAEEFYFVLEGVGRMRVDGQTLSIPKYGGVHVGPALLRQVFNDTENDTLWLIVGAPDREVGPGEQLDMSLIYPTDPKSLPVELAGFEWPPKG